MDSLGYLKLSNKIDDETMFLSGGFERNKSYQKLIEEGQEIIPDLILDIENMGPCWWRMGMICQIAENAMDQCIVFPEEIKGMSESVAKRILDWWKSIDTSK